MVLKGQQGFDNILDFLRRAYHRMGRFCYEQRPQKKRNLNLDPIFFVESVGKIGIKRSWKKITSL